MVHCADGYPAEEQIPLWCKSLKGQYPCANVSAHQFQAKQNLTLTLRPVRALFAKDASAFCNNLDLNFNTLILLS